MCWIDENSVLDVLGTPWVDENNVLEPLRTRWIDENSVLDLRRRRWNNKIVFWGLADGPKEAVALQK